MVAFGMRNLSFSTKPHSRNLISRNGIPANFYDKGFPGQAQVPNAGKLHQKEIKQNDKKNALFEDRLNKQYASNNGEKARENNHLAEENNDSKFLLELDRRIRDNGGAGNQLVQKVTIADHHRKDEGAVRLVAKSGGTWPDGKEKLQDKGINAGKIDGRGIWAEARPIGNAAVSRHSHENSIIGENLKKRKDIESNGVLHANDNWPSKLPRPSSSHPFTENGRILEPCQISFPNASDRLGASTNVKVENKERKINGIIEALPPAISSIKTPAATVPADPVAEAPTKPPHPADPVTEAPTKPPHPDTKYLRQVYSVPKTDEWSGFDDQEWLFGSSSQEKRPVGKSSEAGDTLQWRAVLEKYLHKEPSIGSPIWEEQQHLGLEIDSKLSDAFFCYLHSSNKETSAQVIAMLGALLQVWLGDVVLTSLIIVIHLQSRVHKGSSSDHSFIIFVNMRMLPVCSATPCYSSSSQIPLFGGLLPLCPVRKDLDSRCVAEEGVYLGLQYGTHTARSSFTAQATKTVSGSFSPPSEQGYLTNTWGHSLSNGELRHIERYNLSTVPEELVDIAKESTEGTNTLVAPAQPEILSSTDIMPEKFESVSSSIDVDNESLASTKASVGDLIAGINESFNDSISKGENALRSSLDTATSFIDSIVENANKSADNAFSKAFSAVDQTGEVANKKLTSFSSELSGVTNKAPALAIDVLRRTIIAVESSLASGASYVVYLYGSAKELLPADIRDTVNVYEDKATEILRPVGPATQKIYITFYSLEKSLGLDPNDPIIPFLVFVGSSATLWAVYWLWTYGGYSGDLSPKSALELLTGDKNAALIDVRTEDLREKDGIPDLRRAARFRYASVTPLEVDGSTRKLLKSGRDLDDSLTAAIIRNLKIVKDSSKVIVLDADGTRSKGIARSLRNIGVKNPYLVQGGFQSWMKQSLRVKELKPETALSILNEEAEAILEDVNPSPLQLLGYGTVLIAGFYALLEWEKTLQLIGLFGLSLTIYLRVSSYENSEDLKQDVRLLLVPVRLGAQAFSWAAGKLESNRIGLPTSPSSLDVQNRVLQAAAKHESQPSDSEGNQDPVSESTVPLNQNV
ncbi:Rhodanese-like domain [Sesbania bispinosa]|nr:Rhodanese-like domain [Sesbania bispinosa]